MTRAVLVILAAMLTLSGCLMLGALNVPVSQLTRQVCMDPQYPAECQSDVDWPRFTAPGHVWPR